MRPAGSLRRDLRLSLVDAAGYGVMAGMAEVYVPAFGLALGMSPIAAGLLATLPLAAGGVIQLFAPAAIARVPLLRTWVVACMVLQALSLVPLVVIAVIGGPPAPILYASTAVYWAAGMGVSAGWNPWMARLVPPRLRGRFFGRRQAFGQVLMLTSLVGAGLALQLWARDSILRPIYAGLFGGAVIARLACALAVARQGQGLPPRQRDGRRTALRTIPQVLKRSGRGGMFAYLVTALAATAIAGPFLTPYLLQARGLSYAEYSIATAAVVIAKIGAMPMLGHWIARLGTRRVLVVSAFAISPVPVLWTLSPHLAWILIVQAYSGIAWAGFELGMLIVLFDGDDDTERTAMQVAFSGMQAILTAVASLLGGGLLVALGADQTAYVWLFAASAAARLAAVVLIVRGIPAYLVRLPSRTVSLAWTLAIRPWGGTIAHPIIDRIGRLERFVKRNR